MNTRTFTSLLTLLLISITAFAQGNNIFHDRGFWKNKPDLVTVKQLISEGHDATALNQNAFDATVYALLEKVDSNVIKYLLSLEGNPVDKKTHDSRIYLHWAAYAGHQEMVNYLLDASSSVSQPDSHGYTPLAFAANAGIKNLDIYKAFKKHGVNLQNEKSENGAGLLLLVAASLENEKELNEFLELGLSLNTIDNDGNNIFHYAARKGNIPFLEILIDNGVDHRAVNKNGGNAILMASRGARGHENGLEFYKYLEAKGIAVNVVGDYGRNPLHAIALRTNDVALLDFFIDHGVDINLQDDGGDSPFMNAANSNSLKIVEHLYKKVNQIDAQDKTGKTALAMAINRNTSDVAAFLIDNKANTSVVDNNNNNLAFYLINSYNDRTVDQFNAKLKLLEKEGVPFNVAHEGGNSLYHIAVVKGNLKLIKQLERFDIDINAKNDEGLTALHLAAMKAKDDVILKHLISIGADPTLKTNFEESVFDLASENELLDKHKTSLSFLK